MVPAIKNGDILFVSKIQFSRMFFLTGKKYGLTKPAVKKNDILIFKNDKGEELEKRVAGVPFEFYFLQNGNVTITDEDVGFSSEKEIESLAFSLNTKFIPLMEKGRIPEGYYLLLGDNRNYSTDSRNFGLVPESSIIGKVLWRL